MIQLHHQSKILLATAPVDFRKGIDGFVAICRDILSQTPNNGYYFVFINRSRSRIRLLNYDGSGYWLMTKRLSKGNFLGWPKQGEVIQPILAVTLRTLLTGQTLDNSQYYQA